MLCKNCNQPIPDGSYYCEHCGAPVNDDQYNQKPFEPESSQSQNSYGQPQYDQSQNGYNQAQYSQYGQSTPPYTNPYDGNNSQTYSVMVNSRIDDAKTMGILAIILGIFIPIVGIILGCVGLSKLSSIKQVNPTVTGMNPYDMDTQNRLKKAKTLCITGIVLPIVLWLLAIIFWIIVVFVLGMSSYAMM